MGNPTSLLKHSMEQCSYYRKKTRPNLPFQMALYIDLWIFPVWLLITITNLEAKYESLTSVYKVITLTAVLVLSVFESLKLYLGYLGNLGGKIPELASCWLILTLIQLPLDVFLLFDYEALLHLSKTFVHSFMTCLVLIEIATGMIALKNLADQRAKIFYLAQLYNMHDRH